MLSSGNDSSAPFPAPGDLSSLLALLQGQENLSPQLAGVTNGVGQIDLVEAGIWTASHTFELGDEIWQREGFAYRLRGIGLSGDRDDVDVKMVVRRLVFLRVSKMAGSARLEVRTHNVHRPSVHPFPPRRRRH